MFGIRYIGNTHIPHYKETAALASIDMPAPQSVLLPMGQLIGAPATPIVNPGDTVKIGQKIANFVKNYKSELKKVVWMPKNDLIKSTGIVLLVLVAAVVLIGLLDLGFSALLNLISSIG